MRAMHVLFGVVALALVQPVSAGAQQVPMAAEPGEAEHIATEGTRLMQLLQLLERAQEAIEQGAEGQGENALHNARVMLEELRQDSDHPWLEPTMEELANVQAAVREGNMTWAEARLDHITEQLANQVDREGLERTPSD
jgi:DNA repair ATPase RecN